MEEVAVAAAGHGFEQIFVIVGPHPEGGGGDAPLHQPMDIIRNGVGVGFPHIGQPIGEQNYPIELLGIEVFADLYPAIHPTGVEGRGAAGANAADGL